MKITITEKRLNGARYYAATIHADYPNLCLLTKDWMDAEEWCYNNFGERPMNRWPTPADRWFANDSAFWFRDQEDLMMFVLKWQ